MKRGFWCLLFFGTYQISHCGQSWHFSITSQTPQKITTTPDTTTAPALSTTQQFELDFLYQEINQFSSEFVQNWTDDANIRLILNSAELAVQQSSAATQPIMRQRITQLFADINITITFTSDNLITRADDPTIISMTPDVSHQPTKHAHKIKKQHAITYDKAQGLPELAKIKGARGTLRRVKQKMADQEEQDQQDALNKVKEQMRIREYRRNQDTQPPQDTVNRQEFQENSFLE